MQDNEKHDNSQDQGFFTQKIQIKQTVQHQRSTSTHTKTHFYKPSPFQAKYLPWTGSMKKQPIQALTVANISLNSPIQKAQKKKNKNNIQQHPYKLYACNQNYQLVYSRTKSDPIINSKYFMSNQVKLEHVGSKNATDFKKLKDFDMNDKTELRSGVLAFDSRFQSGNLHCVYKNEKAQEYILFIQNDTNSLGYNQWFYFSVQNNELNVKYTFKIVNFKKKHSFFKYGSKPAVFSLHKAREKGCGWSRRGQNIIYEQSPIYIQELPNNKFYSLTFDLSFDHKDDYILIAMSLPYSYTKMTTFLRQAQMIAQQDPLGTLQFNIKSVCRSVCGNDVPQITITRKIQSQQTKKMIIILARQHPGQIWSSYMVQGMIKRLVSKPDDQMKWLLQNYIIKIFPMVNVDGVIYGNFRCDITGVDLNRRWKDTSKLMHPQVFEIKRKINAYRARHKIQCCFDLHGHSKNYNVFCYSCKTNLHTCRILPLMISHINPIFYFPSCTFGISKYKQSTARAVIYKIIRNENVLTIQSSFYGSKLDGTIRQYGPEEIHKMGEDILIASRYFLDKKSKKYQLTKKQIENRINQFVSYDKINEEDSGSESDPEGDEIDLQTKINNIFNKTLIDIDELKGIKVEKVSSPIKIKLDEQVLQVKSKQYNKKFKSGLVNPNIVMKQIPLYKNQGKNTIEDGHVSILSSQIPKLAQKNKKTISYSQQKSYDIDDSQQLKITNPVFREKQKKFSLHTTAQPKSERRSQNKRAHIKFRQTQEQENKKKLHQSLAEQQLKKNIISNDNSVQQSDFFKKFQKYIPVSMAMKNRSNVTMFQQSLYNEDQTNLIQMLLENKRKIEIEKIKRNVQKSTYLVERQSKAKVAGGGREKVVDFRTFKQNEKVNQQIRKLANIHNMRYNQ